MAASPPFPSFFGPATSLMGSQGPLGPPGGPCYPGRRVLAQDGPEVSLPPVTMGSPEASGGATDLRSWNAREITALCPALREDGSAWGRRRKGEGRVETLGRLPGGGPWAGRQMMSSPFMSVGRLLRGATGKTPLFLPLCSGHADSEVCLHQGGCLNVWHRPSSRSATMCLPETRHTGRGEPALTAIWEAYRGRQASRVPVSRRLSSASGVRLEGGERWASCRQNVVHDEGSASKSRD